MLDAEDYVAETVYIRTGDHSGRVGYVDDTSLEAEAIVYFGSPSICHIRASVDPKHLRVASIDDMRKRMDAIYKMFWLPVHESLSDTDNFALLHEYHLISETLLSRWEHARSIVRDGDGLRIFLSHSSRDKEFVKCLAVELANKGHRPWLDEWEIKVGESIPTSVSSGLDNCDCVIVVLSPHAVESGWVEREWQVKYWDEVSSKEILVLPVLHKQCALPTLLRTKKFANFTLDYQAGLGELVDTLASLVAK